MLFEIILIVIGFIFLVKGADLLVRAASTIAKKFGISEMLIGLTIVAIGTSLPEIFITITSSIEGYSDLIIGNAIGSCICNLLLVIGITSLIKPVKFDKRIISIHFPISVLAILILLFFGNISEIENKNIIYRWQGLILIIFTIAYILYTIYEEKIIKNKKIDEEIINEVKTKENYSIIKVILFLILGIVGLKFGSDFVVDNSILVANKLGLSESFIGMTILAVGTALPEIITGIISAKRNETDLLLGNVTGSNILNICLLIGIGAIINPLLFSAKFNTSLFILIALTLLLQFATVINKKSEINKKMAFILITLYIIYIMVII